MIHKKNDNQDEDKPLIIKDEEIDDYARNVDISETSWEEVRDRHQQDYRKPILRYKDTTPTGVIETKLYTPDMISEDAMKHYYSQNQRLLAQYDKTKPLMDFALIAMADTNNFKAVPDIVEAINTNSQIQTIPSSISSRISTLFQKEQRLILLFLVRKKSPIEGQNKSYIYNLHKYAIIALEELLSVYHLKIMESKSRIDEFLKPVRERLKKEGQDLTLFDHYIEEKSKEFVKKIEDNLDADSDKTVEKMTDTEITQPIKTIQKPTPIVKPDEVSDDAPATAPAAAPADTATKITSLEFDVTIFGIPVKGKVKIGYTE